MKKIIAVVLCLVMIFSFAVPSFAVTADEQSTSFKVVGVLLLLHQVILLDILLLGFIVLLIISLIFMIFKVI